LKKYYGIYDRKIHEIEYVSPEKYEEIMYDDGKKYPDQVEEPYENLFEIKYYI
jgi:hypothetical protein